MTSPSKSLQIIEASFKNLTLNPTNNLIDTNTIGYLNFTNCNFTDIFYAGDIYFNTFLIQIDKIDLQYGKDSIIDNLLSKNVETGVIVVNGFNGTTSENRY
jgi:hypothetical protein